MTDRIPDDIARTARALADELLDRYLDMGLVSALPHIERDMAALAIAKVLDAERRRWQADEDQEPYGLMPVRRVKGV